KKTMMMAQRLYEAGYITYMRTDSTNLSADAVEMARTYIEGEFGAAYLPPAPNVYSSKEGAQEAHEAIRPSDVNTDPSKLSGMERDAERLYELIWRQFVACQMLPAKYLSTTVSVAAGDFELRAKGRILKFDGYTRVMPQIAKPGDDDVLPDMAQGDVLKLIELDPSQHFTKPPARYSEASLVKEMEKRGIGRPSTYAAIIGTIQDRGYVALHNRRFYSEKMGDIVTERLSESFSDLMDYGFTAGMEENLDDVAHGERDWKNVLDEFYGDFKKKLEVAAAPEGGMRANQPVMTDIPCKECGRPMQIRTASTGVFLGCSGYSLPPKERCKATVNLVPGDEIAADDEGESESLVLLGKHRCPICSTAMDAYLLDEKHKLHICGNNPDCTGYEIEEGSYRIKGYEGPSLECDKCGSEMQLKTGRFGKFFGCTNAECKNTRKLLKSGEAAPPKMDPVKMPELKCEKVNDTYILRDGASGLFLAASQFP
ncbi:MAG: topoisomerase DNA-binding C4 zinc finger domain-containing protein, partial [Pseudomonadales bacterium]|nr:topoisomerase DNA-binding C4 zinc finger domain-containing protein [Pseudomonadales bacterium]